MSEDNLHCSACLDDKRLVRILKCKHEICESCCILHLYQSKYVVGILCPLDQEITPLGDAGIDGIKDLPKKIFVQLTCANCSNVFSLQNQWWCDSCGETVCSWCAMKKHRSHDCFSFEEEIVVKKCLEIFKPYCKIVKQNYAQEIDKFCSVLAKELKRRLSSFDEAVNFVSTVESVYGSKVLICSDEKKEKGGEENKNLRKRLNLLNCVLSTIQHETAAFDVDQLMKICENGVNNNLEFPSVGSVADLFFKSNLTPEKSTTVGSSSSLTTGDEERKLYSAQSFTSMDESFSSTETNSKDNPVFRRPADPLPPPSVSPSPQVIQKVSDIPQKVVTNGVESAQQIKKVESFGVHWKASFKCLSYEHPLSLCAIPDEGVVLSTGKGVYMLNRDLKCPKYKGWPVGGFIPPQVFGCAPSMVYHSKRKSVFILKEFTNNRNQDAKKIIELLVSTFIRASASTYPAFPDDDRRLLGVLNNGCLVCATSSMIWVKQFETPKSESVVWTRYPGEFHDSFTELVVGPLSRSGNDVLYFMGRKAVYQFTVFRNSCQLQQIISVDFASTLVLAGVKNAVFVLDKNCDKLIPVVSKQQQQQPSVGCHILLPLIKQMKMNDFAVSIEEKLLYLIDFGTKTLYVGDFVKQ